MNSMLYGQLFPNASDIELESLRRLGARWKVSCGFFPCEAILNFFLLKAIRERRKMGL